ncbi:MAG: hypothetical protein COV74_04770 [Candidatus Omnitrophica bacterium CG11_big_fil_rev_8_21_14_0_20_45_26]|uniref:Uncharacterized protein n=1 Tax=Candidatus Abzuiibacterium crystallinum TaxID=1974748 RepID=A0A2H0LPX3_9BACT|nr:MAG: hypothetical protein COV74_04770 [Candidatus Omnitrophica bacterium CG11_big_fil_rev_8_21_14_0_20_45_26]PIW64195.1 MAG: hypothetical protein COW12_07285 [Candidatus Omnitrophica bacterium CG12_big_fil_rev_8_21_14_0_65_45_16]
MKRIIMLLSVFLIMLNVNAMAEREIQVKEPTMPVRDEQTEARPNFHMSSMMIPKSIAATSDGGVVVLAGSELIKYDQELNEIKHVKVELSTDMEDSFRQMMEEMSKRRKMRYKQGEPTQGRPSEPIFPPKTNDAAS